MANICDTQYKVTGSRKAVADLWNTLQELEVNSNNVYLYLLAEHYGIDYEKKGISVRGHIYWQSMRRTWKTIMPSCPLTPKVLGLHATCSLRR